MKFYKFHIILILIAFITFYSCENNVAANEPSTVVFPGDNTVSFQMHITPFVRQKCAYSGCHSDYSRAGGRRFTDYYTYFETSNLGFVISGNPSSSLFMQVMNGKNPHLVNYRIISPNQNQIDGVNSWIKAGAPLN